MPGNKPPLGRSGPKKGARKPRSHCYARQRMAPTERVEHALAACPECGTDLVGGWIQRTREVIEVPVVPAQVTEHIFVARVCPMCERRRVPKVDLKDAVVGRQRLGVNLVSLIATLREEGRLPIRTIQWYLKTVHQLHMSVGGIVQAIHGVAKQAQGAVAEVLEQIRLLTNLETAKQKLLQIILIAQPELREKLSQTNLRQLAQRITGRY